MSIPARIAIFVCALCLGSCGSSRPPIPPLPQLPREALRAPLWQRGLGGADVPLALQPAYVEGALYAASAGGDVVRLDPATGGEVWRVALRTPISGAIGARADRVAVGTASGEVVLLASDGKILWRVRVSSEVTSPPLVREDLVIARSADGRIAGLDAKSGERRWLFERTPPALVVRGYSGFTTQGPALFTGLAGGRLVAIAAATGAPLWEASVSVPKGTTEIERMTDVIGAPWSSSNQVCAASYQGRVACFDRATGNALWAKDISSASGLTGDPRYLYVSDDKGAVLALDASTGTTAWRDDRLVGRALSAPLIDGTELVVGDMQGYVHFLDAQSGALLARGSTGDPIDVPAIAIPSGVLVQNRDGTLAAFALSPR